MFVMFFDMCSGGGEKTDYSEIIIEAESIEQAEMIFEDRFNRDPRNVTCGCCGPDFSIYEVKDTKPAWCSSDDLLVIPYQNR